MNRRFANDDNSKIFDFNYKDIDFLRRFINDRGKIVSRRITGITTAQQRKLTREIKRARILALLPFTSAHKEG
jgi:small subunit ribosomal protein S18